MDRTLAQQSFIGTTLRVIYGRPCPTVVLFVKEQMQFDAGEKRKKSIVFMGIGFSQRYIDRHRQKYQLATSN